VSFQLAESTSQDLKMGLCGQVRIICQWLFIRGLHDESLARPDSARLCSTFLQPHPLRVCPPCHVRCCECFDSLLGMHLWSSFLKHPTAEDKDKASKVFWCHYNSGRLVQKNGELFPSSLKLEKSDVHWHSSKPRTTHLAIQPSIG
jgi:hypothetical protein